LKLRLSSQFKIFIITGGIAAIVNFGSRFIFEIWFTFSLSIIISYICGMITAYILAKIYVFKESRQTQAKSIFYFTCVNILAVSQTWLISVGLAIHIFPSIGFNFYIKEIAHGIGILVPVFTSYLGHKYLSFAR
tara:strand:- start:159 stop:560 length:402 start_codon:yes stop_codon:yes gene_type:complete